jgi:hypothetical protein
MTIAYSAVLTWLAGTLFRVRKLAGRPTEAGDYVKGDKGIQGGAKLRSSSTTGEGGAHLSHAV